MLDAVSAHQLRFVTFYPAATRWRAVLLALVLVFGGCTAASDVSPAAQRIQSTRSFGDDNRMSITIEPGRVRELYEADRAAWVTALHSSAPFGSVTIENGNFSEQRVLVEAGNYDTTAAVVPRIRRLSDGARRDSRCDQPPYNAAPETLLAPLPLEVVRTEDGGPALLFDLRIPACTTVEVRVTLAPTRIEWTTALVSVDADRIGAFRDALDEVVAANVDHIQVVGRTRRDDDSDPYETVRYELSTLPMPWSVTFRSHDLRTATGFHRAFGVSDWDVAVGNVKLLSLNTSTRSVGNDRFVWLQSRPVARFGGVAVMHVPPYDPNPTGADSLATPTESGRLHSVLASLRYRTVFSSAGDGPAAVELGGIELIDVGRASRRRDSATITYVTLVRPWAEPRQCANNSDCDTSARCNGNGYCATVCTSAEDCPGDVPECTAGGLCAVSAEVLISPDFR
jgi:hypothetical protein